MFFSKELCMLYALEYLLSVAIYHHLRFAIMYIAFYMLIHLRSIMWMFSRARNVNRLLENHLDLNIFLCCQMDNIIIFSEESNSASLTFISKFCNIWDNKYR